MTIMLLEWVFTATFLILVVLALRAALGRRMSAGLRYALWAVVLVRLLVPVQLFTSPIAGTWVFTESRTERNVYKVTGGGLEKGGPEDVLALGEPSGPSVTLTAFPNAPDVPALPDPPEPPAAPDLTKAPAWLGWAWLGGAAAVAFVLLVSNLRFYGRLRRERVLLETADCPLRVYAAAGLPSPCLFGLVRPAVYVARSAAGEKNPDMLRHVLAHEYTHYRHGDHIWSLLRCAALAIHWWNPLVWAAAVCSQRDGELACDQGALKRLGETERAAYGNTLLALVTAKPGPGDLFRCSTAMAGDKKSLKERVSRIAQAPRRVVWAVVVAVAVTALACVCAFGQGSPETAQDPVSSADPTVSVRPDGERWLDIPELLAHFTADTEDVPEDVIHFVGRAVQRRYWEYQSYLKDNPLTDDPIGFDGWRVQALSGPWHGAACDMDLEVWRLNYEFHTTTPDLAMNLVNGGAYLNEDGWLCPTYPNCTYAVFRANEGGKLGYLTSLMANDCSPDGNAQLFFETVATVLGRRGLTGEAGTADGWEQHQVLMFHYPDLNRDGVPETVATTPIDGGMGERVGVWQGADVGNYEAEWWDDAQLLWSDEGYNAHAGYNAVFLCTLEAEDYLLRYHPYMAQGWCSYDYQLFTLTPEGEENVVRENSIEFSVNISSPDIFGGPYDGSFDPEKIASFMDEINGLLENSFQLINTDSDLRDTFAQSGRLYDDLWWLDIWEPVFVRDEDKSLLDNLRDFQTAMEGERSAEAPKVSPVDELGESVQLSYGDKQTRFSCPGWDYRFQLPAGEEAMDARVLDLNGDGRDEIVFSLIWGHGTGCLVENLFAFDADTLEQYDTDRLNERILSSIQSTGDKDNFYLSAPGMDRVAISKSEAAETLGFDFESDAMGVGDIIFYEVGADGAVRCRVACDASGITLGYIGYIEAELEFTGSGFRIARAEYREGDAYSD